MPYPQSSADDLPMAAEDRDEYRTGPEPGDDADPDR
jgi:hypothetical protein